MVRTKKTTTAEKGKKAATKKTVARKSAGTRKSKTSVSTSPVQITPEERWRMIAVAAYHKSEKHGFAPGREMDDWLEAEREVDELLGRR